MEENMQEMQSMETFESAEEQTVPRPEADEPSEVTAQQESLPDRQGELDEFLERYPTVDADAIPKAVWQRFMQGESLSLAYALHENSLLQSRLEQLSRQEDNRRRTPGSLGNSTPEPDELDKYWAQED